jgi:hypothetical protein
LKKRYERCQDEDQEKSTAQRGTRKTGKQQKYEGIVKSKITKKWEN